MYMKDSLAGQAFCPAFKTFNNRIVTSELWSPENDWCSAGVAFHKDGIHKATIWPDADVIHHMLDWNQIEQSGLDAQVSHWLHSVSEVYIDGWSPRLSAHQKWVMNVL